jgi:hypothetical protein
MTADEAVKMWRKGLRDCQEAIQIQESLNNHDAADKMRGELHALLRANTQAMIARTVLKTTAALSDFRRSQEAKEAKEAKEAQ